MWSSSRRRMISHTGSIRLQGCQPGGGCPTLNESETIRGRSDVARHHLAIAGLGLLVCCKRVGARPLRGRLHGRRGVPAQGRRGWIQHRSAGAPVRSAGRGVCGHPGTRPGTVGRDADRSPSGGSGVCRHRPARPAGTAFSRESCFGPHHRRPYSQRSPRCLPRPAAGIPFDHSGGYGQKWETVRKVFELLNDHVNERMQTRFGGTDCMTNRKMVVSP